MGKVNIGRPKEWVFGNDTENVLGNLFDSKISAHIDTPDDMIPPPMQHDIWNQIMKDKCDKRKRSAYINIPFCQTKCLYCSFFKNLYNKKTVDEYVITLIKELEMDRKSGFRKALPFNAVYIGGGTPSTLSPENIKSLTAAIQDNLFMANDCEFTFESRLYQMDDDKFHACLDGGVNRFSFGVQSFNSKVRKSIGRVLDNKSVIERLSYFRDQAQATIVIDLMYGLQYQTHKVWQQDLEIFDSLGLDGCDLYQLIIFKNSDIEKKVENQSISKFASVSEKSRMFEYSIGKMKEMGYTRISNVHWAMTHRERSMYNSMTNSNSIVIPFGSGAGGNASDYRFFLQPNLEKYKELIQESKKPLMVMLKNSPHQGFYKEISGAISEGSLNFTKFNKRFGESCLDVFKSLFDVWEKKGVIKDTGISIDLTVAGQFWSVNLAQAMVDWHRRSLGQKEKGSNVMRLKHPHMQHSGASTHLKHKHMSHNKGQIPSLLPKKDKECEN
jgi:oxygen-independent coproporphyrinogen-3 oxidase